jgi:uncharacterized surface protein with fasciclin (FAS1) repeats
MTDATGGVTMTTTVVTTTVTTVTADAALTGTAELTGTEELTGTAGNAGTDAGAAAALPTPTAVGSTEAGSTNGAAGAVGAADALTVTTPVSTPVAAGAAATSATTATATTATGTTTATGVLTDASAGTILQVINTTPGLETLAAALTASGMATALDQPGPLTFFAPTNEAFAALPEGQLDALLADPGTLAPILQYHIVIDNVAASRLGTLGAALSSSGQPITITVQGDGSLLVNNARLVQADIPAANGAIHLIDQVLLPPAAGGATP